MSSTNNNNGERGITLKSLADLGSVIDLETLPPGPESTVADAAQDRESSADLGATVSQDLASLLAKLASLSGGLENMARQDARAREQATLELAHYETVVAEQHDAERALVEARRLRAGAEQLAAEAFSDEARAQAARHAVTARAAELSCIQLLAERTRVADELASSPHVARASAERRRLAQQQAEAIERAEVERASRLAHGVAAVRAAVGADQLDKAARLLAALTREFAQEQEVQSLADVIRWRERQRVAAPAEDALRDVLRRPYRDDPEAAVALLAGVAMDGLPEDLARRVFGLWSNACAQLVDQRGWHEPYRLRAGHQPWCRLCPPDGSGAIRDRQRAWVARLAAGPDYQGSPAWRTGISCSLARRL